MRGAVDGAAVQPARHLVGLGQAQGTGINRYQGLSGKVQKKGLKSPDLALLVLQSSHPIPCFNKSYQGANIYTDNLYANCRN